MQASVVDLPLPVTPVTSTSPRGSLATLRRTLREPQLLEGRDAHRDDAQDDDHLPALAEDVDAEAREAGDLVRGVDREAGLELFLLVAAEQLVGRAPACPPAVSGGYLSVSVRSPFKRTIGGWPGLMWMSGDARLPRRC